MLRTIFAGKPAALGNRTLRLDRPARSVPIYIAATGPGMLELAGEVADGVIIQIGIHPPCLEECDRARPDRRSGSVT